MKIYRKAKPSEVSWNLVSPPRRVHTPGGPEALAWHSEQHHIRRRWQLYRGFCVGLIVINAALMYLPLQVYDWMPIARNFESLAVLAYSIALLVLLYLPNLACRCISIGAIFGVGIITLLGIVPSLVPPIMYFEIARNGDWAWLILFPVWMLLAAVSVYFAPVLIRFELTLAQVPLVPGTVELASAATAAAGAPPPSKWLRFWQGFILVPLTIHFVSTPYHALLKWNDAGLGTVVEIVGGLGVAAGFIGFMYSRSPFRLLAYGASCYFAVSNCIASIVHVILMPRTNSNRTLFDLVPDPGGWLESAWALIWWCFMVVTVVKAVRLLQADLDQVTGSKIQAAVPTSPAVAGTH